jgi:hypothetical protein
VDPALPARLPLEVLHSVRDINLRSIDPRFFERAIQDFSRGSHEWFTGKVFLVARLFAEEH